MERESFVFKLIQPEGVYSLRGKQYNAGQEYRVPEDVAYKDAFYLIQDAKKAVAITDISQPKPIENKKADEQPLIPVYTKPEILQIGIIRIGGLGDALIMSGLVHAIKRKYPKSFLTVYVRDDLASRVLADNKYINRVVKANKKIWNTLVQSILDKGMFDIFYDNRYVTKVSYRNQKDFEKDKKETDEAFASFKIDDLFNNFPYMNNDFYKRTKINEYELALKSACLEGSRDDLFIKMNIEDYACTDILEDTPYVTVHHGADVGRQTKCWLMEYWEKVVDYLKEGGYKVIQLGVLGDEPIKGCINMAGKTNIRQTAALIDRAKFHIDSESGLVHLARAVRTRSIVLFGPTSYGHFSYPENINIETPNECKDCWWKNDLWWRECGDGGTAFSSCMKAITPELVINEIKYIKFPDDSPLVKRERKEPKVKKNLNEEFAEELLLNEEHYISEPWQYERVELMMNKCKKGGKILEVGAGDGYCVEQLLKRGYDIEGVEFSPLRYSRCKKAGLPVLQGDIHCLPFPDNYFDTVMCGEVLEHIPSMALGMKELERVCKPDGNIIVSVPISAIHDNTKMHLWAIRHHVINREQKPDMLILDMKRINRDE